jgi:hypothetical protein
VVIEMVDCESDVSVSSPFDGMVKVTGGNAVNRSAKRNKQELDYLQRKWGKYLEVTQSKGTTLLKLHVQRQQKTIQLAGDD